MEILIIILHHITNLLLVIWYVNRTMLINLSSKKEIPIHSNKGKIPKTSFNLEIQRVLNKETTYQERRTHREYRRYNLRNKYQEIKGKANKVEIQFFRSNGTQNRLNKCTIIIWKIAITIAKVMEMILAFRVPLNLHC